MITRYDKDNHPVICPQPGPQEAFCASTADIVIYGGAAFGGKTVALLMEGTRNVADERYTGVIFRRKYKEIVDGGGLWDTSMQIYPMLGGSGSRGRTEWTFPSGCRLKMNHLNQERDVETHQGSAYVYLAFDELTHFTEYQFFYLLSRNRPPAGCMLRPYCRATTNPDADSWVSKFIQWWWDPETGYPIPERSGVIRYFTRMENEIVWVSPDWRDEFGNPPKSVTFISSGIEDNQLGIVSDPGYRANLLAQDKVTRERLLRGNWLITFGGNMFDPLWFKIVDASEIPADLQMVRYWDMAASEVKEQDKHDPDWTCGGLCGIKDGILYVVDLNFFREAPGTTERIMRETAEQDGHEVAVWWEEEKGSSGKFATEYMKKIFRGFEAHADPVSGSKVERARPWAAYAEFSRVYIVRAQWNRQFLAWVGKFPDGKRDAVDSISGAFKVLVGPKRVFNAYLPIDNGHLKNFSREKEDFEKIQPHNVEVYCVLWATPDGGVYGGCYLWSRTAKRLRLYNEIYHPNPVAGQLAQDIKDKLVVPLKQKPNYVTVEKIICNEEMAKTGKASMYKELKRYGIRPHITTVYDESGSIFRGNTMFQTNQIWLHSDCVETDVEIRGWGLERGRPAQGYPLARGLCLMISQLKSEFKVQQDYIAPHYNKQRIAVREKLKELGSETKPTVILTTQKENDWLTR